MFSGRHELKKVNGKIFVDRDPRFFNLMINYLRNDMEISHFENKFEEGQFYKELEFWCIPRPMKLNKTMRDLIDAFKE